MTEPDQLGDAAPSFAATRAERFRVRAVVLLSCRVGVWTPAVASADHDLDWDLARIARAWEAKHFKPGTCRGETTTQGRPISFKALQSRASRFTAEIEIHCSSPAPAESGRVLGLAPVRHDALRNSIGLLDSPAAIGAWLASTTRREWLRILQAPVRELRTDEPPTGDDGLAEELDAGLIAAERREALDRALGALPRAAPAPRDAAFDGRVSRLSADEREARDAIGSIGPIRRRCPVRLASDDDLAAMASALD